MMEVKHLSRESSDVPCQLWCGLADPLPASPGSEDLKRQHSVCPLYPSVAWPPLMAGRIAESGNDALHVVSACDFDA